MEEKCNFIETENQVFKIKDYETKVNVIFLPQYDFAVMNEKRIRYTFIEDNGVFKI